jgi:hypothetical protein
MLKTTLFLSFFALAYSATAQNFLTTKGIEFSSHIRFDGSYNARIGVYPVKNFGLALVYGNRADLPDEKFPQIGGEICKNFDVEDSRFKFSLVGGASYVAYTRKGVTKDGAAYKIGGNLYYALQTQGDVNHSPTIFYPFIGFAQNWQQQVRNYINNDFYLLPENILYFKTGFFFGTKFSKFTIAISPQLQAAMRQSGNYQLLLEGRIGYDF